MYFSGFVGQITEREGDIRSLFVVESYVDFQLSSMPAGVCLCHECLDSFTCKVYWLTATIRHHTLFFQLVICKLNDRKTKEG